MEKKIVFLKLLVLLFLITSCNRREKSTLYTLDFKKYSDYNIMISLPKGTHVKWENKSHSFPKFKITHKNNIYEVNLNMEGCATGANSKIETNWRYNETISRYGTINRFKVDSVSRSFIFINEFGKKKYRYEHCYNLDIVSYFLIFEVEVTKNSDLKNIYSHFKEVHNSIRIKNKITVID